MCGYFCIGFIDFKLAGKKLTDYTNLFSRHDFRKKRSYDFVLFEKLMNVVLLKQLTKQFYLNKQNFD